MDGCSNKIPLLVVAGPTAVGKTACAIELAKRLDGEIVCADSMQIYQDLTIGTAKPTAEERRAAVHHMTDFLSPAKRYSVADYVQAAGEIIADIAARGKCPILCGGTGLYVSSLVHGVQFQPQNDNGTDALRQELYALYEKEGVQPLLDMLREKDPKLCEEIHPNNVKRLIRSIERLQDTTATTADIHEASVAVPSPYDVHLAVLHDSDREALYGRIGHRVDIMLQLGLLEEARYVYENRDRFLTAAQAIGYKELFPYFAGEAALSACVDALKQSTRRYAKRQLSWFKREQEAVWYDVGEIAPPMLYDRIAADFNCKFSSK